MDMDRTALRRPATAHPREASPGRFVVRSIAPADHEALADFYAGLSEDVRTARFHGASAGIADRLTDVFCGPDHVHREGLVAEAVGVTGPPLIIGHLCLEPVSDIEVEMAIAVTDAWQHQGVGRSLLRDAIAWARAHRIARMVASMRWSDPAILGLVRSSGCPMTFTGRDEGVLDAVLDVGPPAVRAA